MTVLWAHGAVVYCVNIGAFVYSYGSAALVTRIGLTGRADYVLIKKKQSHIR